MSRISNNSNRRPCRSASLLFVAVHNRSSQGCPPPFLCSVLLNGTLEPQISESGASSSGVQGPRAVTRASRFRSGKLNGERCEFYGLDGEAGALSKCFSSKVTSVICQLHASVFSMRLHFGAHKRAVLYVHCKMWYSGVKQCARNGSLITTGLRLSDLVLFLAPGCLHSVLLIYQLCYTAYCLITQKQTISSQLK